MEAARRFRDLKRERKHLGERDKELIRQEQMLNELILSYVEQGLLTHKIPLKEQGGGTVFQRHETWAKVREGVSREDLERVFNEYGLGYMLKPPNVNSRSLSSWLKSELPTDEEHALLSAEEKAAKVLPAELLELLEITEKDVTAANGL